MRSDADEDATNTAASQEMRRHVVGDQRVGDARTSQLPRRQPRALQDRPRLIYIDVEALACLMRGEDWRQRRTHPGGRQRARVAVRQQRVAIGDQLGAEAAHRAAGGGVLFGDGVRLAQQPLRQFGYRRLVGDAQQPVERPGRG